MVDRAAVVVATRRRGIVKLLLDEMYPPALSEKLRAQGHDVLAVTADADLVGCDDRAVLAYAGAAQRCVVTENVQDFAVLAGHTAHCGILFVHPRRWRRDGVGIARLAVALEQAERQQGVPGPDETRWLT